MSERGGFRAWLSVHVRRFAGKSSARAVCSASCEVRMEQKHSRGGKRCAHLCSAIVPVSTYHHHLHSLSKRDTDPDRFGK